MRDEYPGHRTLRDGVVPWTWDVGLGIAPDDGLPLYGPGFVLFASVENAACIYHSGHGTRALYYDYVVSFNLVNCPSKTFSPIYAIHCPLSFFHPRIFFYLSTLSTLLYSIPSGGVSPTPHASGQPRLSDKSGTTPETSPLHSLSFWPLLFIIFALVCYRHFGLLVLCACKQRKKELIPLRPASAWTQ